jgi:hypothetical protein
VEDYSYIPQTSVGWWEDGDDANLTEDETAKERANSLIDCAKNLEDLQREVHEQNLFSAQLYSNRELAAFDWGTGQLYRASLAPLNMVGENLVLSVVDTMVNHVGKNRPKAKPVTRGASWKLRRRANLLDKFLYGEFCRNKVYKVGKQVYRDAAIFGFGAAYVSVKNKKLCVERVFPDEILIDQMEVVAVGKPRHIYRRRILPVEIVAEMFDCEVDELQECAKGNSYVDYRSIGKGYIVLIEGWQLARGEMVGKYMAACSGKILKEEDWKEEHAPFVFYHYAVPPSGFYYGGAVEQALPYQIRLNEINEVIRDAQDLMGRPRLLVAEGSKVNPYEVTNVVAKIIKYTGIKPEVANWPAVNAELYNERDRCWGQCREQFGLNNLTSSAAPPPGARFDSSEAFREFNSIQDDRLSDQAQRFEEFYLELAETMIRVVKQSGETPKTVWYSGGKRSRLEVIDWSKINLDEDCYVLQLEATSLYDSSPSAIRDSLEKQLAMGLISPDEYRLEVAHPDDAAELTIKAAAAADLRRVVELLEDGKWENPTPMQDLPNGVELVTLACLNLNQYEDDEDDEDAPKLATIQLNMTNWVTSARGWMMKGAEMDETNDPTMSGAPMDPSMGPQIDPMTGQPTQPMMPAGTPALSGAGIGPNAGVNPMAPGGIAPPMMPPQ